MMMIARGLVSESGIAERAVHAGVARLAESIVADGGAPLEVVLPDGARVGFGKPARIKLIIRDPDALAQLANPSLASLAETYVHGRIEVQGDLLEAMPLAEQLASTGGSSVAQRVVAAMLSGRLVRHSAREDRAAISYHYDVSNEFYRLWLDEQMV
jgi:cyclopropane-fatty-acyl-phospholipid synthase